MRIREFEERQKEFLKNVFGSVITYSFVGSAVAPGQIELKEMVRIRSLLFS